MSCIEQMAGFLFLGEKSISVSFTNVTFRLMNLNIYFFYSLRNDFHMKNSLCNIFHEGLEEGEKKNATAAFRKQTEKHEPNKLMDSAVHNNELCRSLRVYATHLLKICLFCSISASNTRFLFHSKSLFVFIKI